MAKLTSETARLMAAIRHYKQGHKISDESKLILKDLLERHQSKEETWHITKIIESELVRFYFVVDYKKGEHPINFEAYWVGHENEFCSFKSKCNKFMEKIDEAISKAFDTIGIRVGFSHTTKEIKHGETSVNLDNRLRRYRLDTIWKSVME